TDCRLLRARRAPDDLRLRPPPACRLGGGQGTAGPARLQAPAQCRQHRRSAGPHPRRHRRHPLHPHFRPGTSSMTETIQTAQSPQLTETAPRPRRQFGSDNYAGICPEAMEALIQANQGHVTAYGTDPYTQEASEAIRRVFETDCEVYFVFNG